MRLATVVGTVVSTLKDPSLDDHKLLLIRPIDRQGEFKGPASVAVDSVGAGIGERVFYLANKEGSYPWHPDLVSSDCSIIGIIDPQNFNKAVE